MIKLDIKLTGAESLSRILMMESDKLNDFRKPLKRCADLLLKEIKINFQTQGGLVNGWTPLAQSTIEGRLRKGYGASPILVNTGRYRDSFYDNVNKSRAIIGSRDVEYHKYHQSTKPRTRLPRRPTLFLREQSKREMVRYFQEYIKFGSKK